MAWTRSDEDAANLSAELAERRRSDTAERPMTFTAAEAETVRAELSEARKMFERLQAANRREFRLAREIGDRVAGIKRLERLFARSPAPG